MEPLRKLTKEKAKFQWKEEQQKAFDAIKAKCSEAIMIACPKINEPLHLRANACDVQIGGMMTHGNKVLATCSTKLNEAQTNNPTTEKELLVVDKCCQVFSNVIKNTAIISRTFHMNLTHSLATKHTSQRVVRQMIRVTQDHDIKQFKHIDRDKTTGGDSLSRLLMQEDVADNEIFMKIKQHTFKHMFPLDLNHAQLKQLKDRELNSFGPSSSNNQHQK